LARLFTRRGGETLVNTETSGNQSVGNIASLPGGGFVVVWTDNSAIGADASLSGIKAQIFDASGSKVGGEFLVNSATAGSQSGSTVATLSSGQFVVAWTDSNGENGDGANAAVRAQIFNANGTTAGGEFLVNTTTADSQVVTGISQLVGGGFVITWVDLSSSPVNDVDLDIRAQVYSSGGERVGGEILVNTTTAGFQNNSSVIPLDNGGFVVAWAGAADAVTGAATALQFFDAAGNRIGGEQAFATGASGTSMAALDSGFVIAWVSSGSSADTFGSAVEVQLFDDTGARIGDQILVNTITPGSQAAAHVDALPGGGFIVFWRGPGGGDGTNDVRAQVFDAAGEKVGAEFVLNEVTGGEQNFPKATVLASGDIAIAWTDSSGVGGDLSGSGIKLQILTPATTGATDIALSNATISETAVENLSVAQISTAGGALNATFTYVIVSDSTDGGFRIEGDRLVVDDNSRLDFETQPNPTIRIRATDEVGNSYEETIALTVTDVAGETRYLAGEKFMVNTATLGLNSPESVTPLASGGFLVVTAFTGVGGFSPFGIRGQIYNADGTAVGDEFPIDLPDRFNEGGPVAALPTGGFVMAFEASDPTVDGTPISAQRFDAAGHKVGGEIFLGLSSGFSHPSIAALASGGFVVSWALPRDEDPSNTAPFQSQIIARIVDPAGTPIGGEFRVNTVTDGAQVEPQVAGLQGGGFVVVWKDGPLSGLQVQIFDAAGTKVGAQFGIAGNNPEDVHLTALADGNILLTWSQEAAPGMSETLYDVWATLIAPQGNLSGTVTPLIVDVTDRDFDVAAMASGGFVVSYSTIGADDRTEGRRDTLGQVFDSSLARSGDAFVVDSATATLEHGAVAVLESGQMVFAWTATFSEADAFARLVSLTPNLIAGTAAGDSLNGTPDPDEILGLDGNDTLTGDSGNDTLNGGRGTDSLAGGDGNDSLNGGADNDTMVGGNGNDIYFVDLASDAVNEVVGAGMDEVRTGLASYTVAANVEQLTGTSSLGQSLTGNGLANFISGGTGADTFAGGLGDDVYVVGIGDHVLENSAQGNDQVRTALGSYTLGANLETLVGTSSTGQTLTGNGLANVITGGDGNDVLNGGAGADTMRGGPGQDLYMVDADDVVVENPTDADGRADEVRTLLSTYTLATNVENLTGTSTVGQTLTGNGSANVIRGGGGNDVLAGGVGFDQLFGGAGNDVLDGGADSDSLTGGLGNDTYIVDLGWETLRELAGEGTDEVRTTWFGFTLGDNIENLTGLSADGHHLTGNELGNIIKGGSGSSQLDGLLGDDTLIGGQGADRLDGGAGADIMQGGAGNDVYFVDNVGDQVIETLAAGGTDTVHSGVDFTLDANVDNLILEGTLGIAGAGNALANQLTGNAAANRLDGGGGTDVMTGGAGNDTYVVDNTADHIIESPSFDGGVDSVESSVSFVLEDFVENVALTGAATINATGNTLANLLTGNGANNVLNGGGGADTMTGGNGNDTYVVDDAGDQVLETAAAGGTDLVQSAIGYTLAANLENLTLTGAGAIDGTGNALANVLTGNGAANLLDGGAGADTMRGGAGNDIYIVGSAGDQAIETLAADGVDRVQSSVNFILGSFVENLTLTGT
jgi:serralysin